MEKRTAEIQSIRSKYEYLVTNELKKPRQNYTTSLEIIKSITVILKKGPVVTDISPLREFFKTAIRNRFDRFSHFPLPLPVFQILPRLIRLNDQPTGLLTQALDTTAHLALYANRAVTELITIIEFINATWEFLQEVRIFNTKIETISRVWVPKQQGIFSLYHPLKRLSSIPPRTERKVNFALQSDNQHNKSERLPYSSVVFGSEFTAPFQPNYPRSGVHSSDIDTPNYLSGACATSEVNQKSPDEDTVSEKVFNFCNNIGRFDSFAAQTESRNPNTDRDFVERNCNTEQTNRPTKPSKTGIKKTSYGGGRKNQ
jgi:hypothetical protein